MTTNIDSRIDPTLQLVDATLAEATDAERKEFLEALIGALDVRLDTVISDLALDDDVRIVGDVPLGDRPRRQGDQIT